MTPKKCECEVCCDGDHPGECKECAGWGEVAGTPCDHCDGEGLCPVCRGAAGQFDCIECRDRGGPLGTRCNACGQPNDEQ